MGFLRKLLLKVIYFLTKHKINKINVLDSKSTLQLIINHELFDLAMENLILSMATVDLNFSVILEHYKVNYAKFFTSVPQKT